jgi:hypothetical protein
MLSRVIVSRAIDAYNEVAKYSRPGREVDVKAHGGSKAGERIFATKALF